MNTKLQMQVVSMAVAATFSAFAFAAGGSKSNISVDAVVQVGGAQGGGENKQNMAVGNAKNGGESIRASRHQTCIQRPESRGCAVDASLQD